MEGGMKRRSGLAVFEHVLEKERKPKYRNVRNRCILADDDDEDEDEPKPVKKKTVTTVRIKSSEESLNLVCQWNSCGERYYEFDGYYKHVIVHATSLIDGIDRIKCRWTNCPNPSGINTLPLLIRHIAYHSYLEKLINIGENVLTRNNLPPCTLKLDYSINIRLSGYTCEYDGCDLTFNTIHDFLLHVLAHVKNNPTRITESNKNETIKCGWFGCTSTKFSTQYKLMEHVRVHTKEKLIACPTCLTLFSTKTKFCDHRNRQLKEKLRSYQCSQCLKLFPSERLLSDHMRSHINQYKCTMCDMTCAKPSILAKHFRYRHLNERLFKCTKCDKRFITKCNLMGHLLTHEKKPFRCGRCSFGCKSKAGLDNHIATTHDKNKKVTKYECPECKKYLSRGDMLTKHLIKLHKFHWPSGHSRFRYRRDQDGICRLQTVRYESLEVTEEMIRSESMPPSNNEAGYTYHVNCGKIGKNGYNLTVVEKKAEHLEEIKQSGNNVLITIEDLDEDGNVIKSQVIESDEVFIEDKHSLPATVPTKSLPDLSDPKAQLNEFIKFDATKPGNEKKEDDEDIRYFSNDVIMNYDKFKIETPKT